VFEKDGLTPNAIYPKLVEAYKMIKLAYSNPGVDITPGDISKSLRVPDNFVQEYKISLINNTDKNTIVGLNYVLPEGWSVIKEIKSVEVPAKKNKQIKLLVDAGIIKELPVITDYKLGIEIKSELLKENVTLNRQITLSPVKALNCSKSVKEINVDADLTEWDMVGTVIDNSCYVSGAYSDITKNDTVPGTIYAGYDDKNLYFAVKTVNKNVQGRFSGNAIWQDDCLELWFDAGNKVNNEKNNMPKDPFKFQVNVTPMTDNKVESSAWVYRNPDEKAMEQLRSSIKSKSVLWEKDGNKGYMIELSVPIDKIKGLGKITAGKTIGFNVSLCNRDSANQWHQRVWTGTNPADAATWGKLVFK
jgi:hypothetical protein